ncbi:AMP-binding enzyme [Streptomyces pinistramenti]|uniref:AMP-binding enzyme n=1 Tax=Streptomyces pinistramenti TaxID=2884812 RepID=UPI001D068AEC|nr:hypothetical protein [Streptomyces pinistramenti]MCB5908125.1 hypothetical protein [Streptomyces pinistramenti]
MVEGRIKDLINRGGEKVSAAEIEELLLTHPDIARAAVVAMPDALLGERTCAYVVPDEGGGEPPTLASVRTLQQARGFAQYKFIDRLDIVDRLPLTALGKVDKKALIAALAPRTGETA